MIYLTNNSSDLYPSEPYASKKAVLILTAMQNGFILSTIDLQKSSNGSLLDSIKNSGILFKSGSRPRHKNDFFCWIC